MDNKQQRNVLEKHMHRIHKIHFVGIGGSGMNVIAEVMIDMGYEVSGSDLSENKSTKRLEKKGVKVYIGHKKENVKNIDLLVVSSAIKDDNCEVIIARKNDTPIIGRAEMLAEVMRFKYGIAVSGTHGKTTTTSMLATVLSDADLSPSYLIGGILNREQTGARLGKGNYLVAEADESDASFLNLTPMMSIVLNIDEDHMETYNGDVELLKKTFINFIERMPFYGLTIVCLDDPIIFDILKRITRPIKTYSIKNKDANIFADNIKADGVKTCFDLYVDGNFFGKHIVNMPGRHNVLNALSVIAVCLELEIPIDIVSKSLLFFQGVGRRFTLKGSINSDKEGALVYEDYGHHPKELQELLSATRNAFPNKNVFGVFQPHRYSRTQELFDDFSQVLSQFDKLVLTEVFPAGEDPIPAANSKNLARAIRARNQVEPILVNINEAEETTRRLADKNDVVLVMGAGATIGQVATELTIKK